MTPEDIEHYSAYYAEKLWSLMPAAYRTADTTVEEDKDHWDEVSGPLREILKRIGVQVGVIRRSIDRAWEDQSIETCDDWIIPYIGDLLATNLVSSLDARGRRLDVANTIYYRRRAGTVGILEEIAHDITSWDARVVECSRRLTWSRHPLDPEGGTPAEPNDPGGYASLLTAEGLIGRSSQTPIGGYADLRSVYGASKVGTPFDEYSHTADFRRGRAKAGWHNISNLGVFLWRLKSFAVVQATPVPCATAGLYAFDPTGRKLPLFARSARSKEAAYGDHWVSSEEWQMPGPLRKSLYEREQTNLYPRSLEDFRKAGSFYDSVDPAQVTVFPELGTFQVAAALQNEALLASYHYGFSSLIGAGPYDRRIVKSPPASGPATIVSGGGALPALPTSGTTTIEDSQTYDSPAAVAAIQDLTLRAGNEQRPLIRLDRWTPWRLTGSSNSSRLTMDGAFISGGNVVIAGDFDTITLTCCTLDPGSSGGTQNPPAILADSVQGQPLWPARLWVEGNVRLLEIERCVVGPIRTRSGGDVETIRIHDSIVQGIRTEDFGDFIELKDPDRLIRRLEGPTGPLSIYLWSPVTPSPTTISS